MNTAAQPVLFPAPPRRPRPGAPVSRYRLELVREADPPPWLVDESLSRPAHCARWIWEKICEREPREVFGVIFLDSRHHVIGYHVAYAGALAGCKVEPRGVFAPALLANAAAVLLFHNHPSGDPTPSREDLVFTRRIAQAGDILGIHLVDHLVIAGGDSWVSLRERGGW